MLFYVKEMSFKVCKLVLEELKDVLQSRLCLLFHYDLNSHFLFLPSLFFSLTTVSVVHCVKKTLACMSPSLSTGKSLFLQMGNSLYIQSFEFESQHTDSAISSMLVPPMNRRECSFSTRKPRFSCTLQRHDSLSAMDGWATQNGRIWQNKEYEILQSGLSRRNLHCRVFMVSFKNLFCFFIFPLVTVCDFPAVRQLFSSLVIKDSTLLCSL